MVCASALSFLDWKICAIQELSINYHYHYVSDKAVTVSQPVVNKRVIGYSEYTLCKIVDSENWLKGHSGSSVNSIQVRENEIENEISIRIKSGQKRNFFDLCS